MFIEYALTAKLLLPSCGASILAYAQTLCPILGEDSCDCRPVEAILPSVRIISLGVKEL